MRERFKISEQEFLTLKEGDDFFENRSFIVLNFRNKRIQKNKNIISEKSKTYKRTKIRF